LQLETALATLVTTWFTLFSISLQWWRTMPEIFSKEGWQVRTRGTRLLIFFSLYSRRSFLLISNCNTHKCSIARRQERGIRSFAMSIAKHLMWFTSSTVTSAGRNT
jgi:hypothetical protein